MLTVLLRYRLLLPLCACLVSLASAPCRPADQATEIAARTLLGEAEKLIECALPQEALPVLDRVKSDYPGTEAVNFAELRRAQCFLFLHRHQESITTARAIVDSHPRTALAGWAQSCLGQAMINKGDVIQGVKELLKVQAILPDKQDLGPLNDAHGAIGALCVKQLKEDSDPLDAMTPLGLDKSSSSVKAQVLAIVAVYRAKQGRNDLANPILSRLSSEYPAETAEYQWARSEVAQETVSTDSVYTANAVTVLSSVMASSTASPYEAVGTAIALAKHHVRKGRVEEALATLKAVKAQDVRTARFAEMLYEMGNILYQQGKADEALAVLKQIGEGMKVSGYAAPALYSIGVHATAHRFASIEALRQLAEGNYDQKWRGLAMWRLGSLYKSSDVAKARDCYMRAIEVFQNCLATQKADVSVDWQEMLKVRIAQIKAEMESIPGEEVSK